MITTIRQLSQQLATPQFDHPADLVRWMGAMQAQDYSMVRWALGLRLNHPQLSTIEEALRKGEIVRTHIMRPTWHLVPAEDLRWMLTLSCDRLQLTNESYAKYMKVPDMAYNKYYDLLGKTLAGNRHLTKQEITEEFNQLGFKTDAPMIARLLFHAESEGMVCSGIDKGRKATYALVEERIPVKKELHKEEALAKLATRYFRSHSPASLQDFTWWSGLTVKDARKAILLIDQELSKETINNQELYFHHSYKGHTIEKDVIHLMPPFDEYLISYKDRTAALSLEDYPKAFNNFGIFYPVILYNGQIVGNWKKSIKKRRSHHKHFLL